MTSRKNQKVQVFGDIIFEFIDEKQDWTIEILLIVLLGLYSVFGMLFLGPDGFVRSVYNSGFLILTLISLVGVFGTILKNWAEGQRTWGPDFKMLGVILAIFLFVLVVLPAGALTVETYKATGIVGFKNPGNPRVYLLGVENFKPQTFSPSFSLAPASLWEKIVGAEYNARIDVSCGGETTFEKGVDVRLGGLLGDQKKQVRTDLYKIRRGERCTMEVELTHFGEVVDQASFNFNSPGKTVEV